MDSAKMGRSEILQKKEILGENNAGNAYGMRNKCKKILRFFGGGLRKGEKNFTHGCPPEKKSKSDRPKVCNFNGSRDRGGLLARKMTDSWLELPDTLKRKRERISKEILSEYHSNDGSGDERDVRQRAEDDCGIDVGKNLLKLGFSNFRSYMLKHYSDEVEKIGCEHFGKRFGVEESEAAPVRDGRKIGCEPAKSVKLRDGHETEEKGKAKHRGKSQSDEDCGEDGKSSETKKAKRCRESSTLHAAISPASNPNAVDETGSGRETNGTAAPHSMQASPDKAESFRSTSGSHLNNSGSNESRCGDSEAEAAYAILSKGSIKNCRPRIASAQFRKPNESSKVQSAKSERFEDPRTENESAVPRKEHPDKPPRGGEEEVEAKNFPDTATGGVSNTPGLFVNEDYESFAVAFYPSSTKMKNLIPDESAADDGSADPNPNPRLAGKATPEGSEADAKGKTSNFKHYSDDERAKKRSAEAIAKELSTQVFNRRQGEVGKRDAEERTPEERAAEVSGDVSASEKRGPVEAPESGDGDGGPENGNRTEVPHPTVADHVRAIETCAARAAKPTGMETIAEERDSDLSEKPTIHEILHRFEELGGRRERIPGKAEERKANPGEIHQDSKFSVEKPKGFESGNGKKYQQSAENVRIVDKTSGGWTGKGPVNRSVQPSGRTGENDEESAPAAVHDGKHSLLQFAIHHFRQSPEKFEMLKTSDGSISGSLKVIEGKSKKSKEKGKVAAKDPSEWTWKEQVDLVKFNAKPIEQSLLRLDTTELNDLAVECFVCLMRYMGDLPMPTDVSEVKCVYTILMHCHRFEQLRDEVYCQLMKQTTNNKSVQQESCQRGWRLFSIVAAYFLCSDTLKPFLFKYLETAAYDKRRAYHGTATVCLQNLRKTFKYGGRKNVPSVEEITAISAGRNSKRQIYRLPGGTEKVVNTKSTTVVQDVIEELCIMINVTNPQEMEEFSVYCIVEGDTFTMPLAREEYILDVTTELQKNHQVFCLIFCRSVWSYPLRLDSQLYVEVVFNQIAPDYLEGLLLVMPGESLEQEFIYDIAKIAALLHRAADMTHVPTMKETKFLLPKPALSVRDVKPSQWVNMVQSNWQECENITTIQAKAQFLDVLSKWPLFGSSFFAIKKASEPKERTDQILALNRNGVHFIDLATHETLLQYPFSEVISTRKVKSEDGTLFLDMKCGNLMQQRITRLQTDQAHEISRLIRQYITIQQITNSNHMQ